MHFLSWWYFKTCVHFKIIPKNYSWLFPDSPYGDVSGLPDPYTGHDISDELLRQTGAMDGASNTGISLGSHDTADMGAMMGQHHEGYTTPSRRVIREIIV